MKYSIVNMGMTLFSSNSVIECFEYFKDNIENMPKSYKNCSLHIDDYVSPAPVPSPALVPGVSHSDDKIVHIHIHIGK